MRHGVAFRKLSRTSSHRDLLLRNLVTSLIQHEKIKTTLAKAKEASRVAEWVITWGKSGRLEDVRRAESYLMNPDKTVPKLFRELSHRYAHRQGGYTRIHRFGNRKGDNAPHAILELVDNPADLKFSMTARIVGRELARIANAPEEKAAQDHPATRTVRPGSRNSSKGGSSSSSRKAHVASWATSSSVTSGTSDAPITDLSSLPSIYSMLNGKTRDNVLKVLRFRTSGPPLAAFSESAEDSAPQASTSGADASTSESLTTEAVQTRAASSPAVPSSSTRTSALAEFESIARDAFFKATVISKVPDWRIDADKLSDLAANSDTPSGRPGEVPVTLPGYGRKLWAGQEGIVEARRSDTRQQHEDDFEADEEGWEDEVRSDAADGQARRERVQSLQKRKMRHPNGRNGDRSQAVPAGRHVPRGRSALSRAKGNQAAPRDMAHRRSRVDMPQI